ncbi:MAG: hypothetical protein QOJ13_525 [Gaiellales bacterium]|nr:hypothetical protein [Gaiellales bacterium]
MGRAQIRVKTYPVRVEAGNGSLFFGQCTRSMIVRFYRTLKAGDTRCARTPEQPTLVTPSFPRTVAEAAPAGTAGGGSASVRARRVTTAAAATALDALKRFFVFPDVALDGVGLRGGAFHASINGAASAARVRLNGARFASDLAVSGRATIRFSDNHLAATLFLSGRPSDRGHLRISGSWPALGNGLLTARGVVGGHTVELLVAAA